MLSFYMYYSYRVYSQLYFNTNYKLLNVLFSKAIGRLGGRDMEEECKELRIKRLNQSTIPWNIRCKY